VYPGVSGATPKWSGDMPTMVGYMRSFIQRGGIQMETHRQIDPQKSSEEQEHLDLRAKRRILIG
jgi:hypothetical protein